MATTVPDELRLVTSPILTSLPEDWWIRDLTDSYPWLDTAEIYWVIDTMSPKSAMVLHGLKDDVWLCLNHRAGMPADPAMAEVRPAFISAVLRDNTDNAVLETFSALQLARLLMEWYRDPRGHICGPEFLADQEDVLDTFLVEETEQQMHLLQEVCSPSVTLDQDAERWTLSFRTLDQDGGVSDWTVHGTPEPFLIEEIVIAPVKPEGTFYYPDEL